MGRRTNDLAVAEAVDTRRNQGGKDPAHPKMVSVNVPVSTALKARVEQAAIEAGITQAEWVRQAIESVLVRQATRAVTS